MKLQWGTGAVRNQWGDDDIENDCVDAEPCPSRRDALKAVSTVQWYIQDIDEPFAHKLESILASFGHQTHLDNLKSTV